MSAASAWPVFLRAASCLSTCAMPSPMRLLRDPLELQIERRVDVDRRVALQHAAVLVVDELADVVHEVRRLVLEGAGGDLEGLGRSLVRVLFRHVLGVGHLGQDDVAALCARSGLRNGDSRDGDWIRPAIVAASARVMLLRSLPKKIRSASATP